MIIDNIPPIKNLVILILIEILAFLSEMIIAKMETLKLA
jgi:hypothetical protein